MSRRTARPALLSALFGARTQVAWLAALALVVACSSGSRRATQDAEDTADVPTFDFEILDEPDTTVVPDTTDTAQDTAPDTAADTTPDLPDPPLPTPADVTAVGVDSVTGLLDAAAADVDGDGLADLIGVRSASELVIARFDPAGGLRPPFAFEAPITVALPFAAVSVRAADVDGDHRTDVAVYDPASGKLGVLLNAGGPVATAFENPVIAFENPVIAFENPVIAADADWLVADLDGNGQQDFAFFGGDEGIVVVWSTLPSDASGPALAFQAARPAGLSDFENPVIAQPIRGVALDLDGAGGADLMVGYALANDPSHDAVAVFVSGPAQTFENPVIAMGGDRVLVGKNLRDVASSDLNGDGRQDLAWLSSAGGASTVGVWMSDFENPVIANEPALSSFAGDSARLDTGRLLVDQQAGLGGGGQDGLAQLNAVSHLLVRPAGSGDVVAIGVRPDNVLVAPLQLQGSLAAQGLPFDGNGDGFTEFVGAGAEGFALAFQALLLDGNYETDPITLADGTTALLCELAAPYCDAGARGVCSYARAGCGGVCAAGTGFEAQFGATFEALHEATGELSCDTWDNDCDGVWDVIARPSLELGTQFTDAGRIIPVPLLDQLALVATPATSGTFQLLLVSDLAAPPDVPFNLELFAQSGDLIDVASDGTTVAALVMSLQGGLQMLLFSGPEPLYMSFYYSGPPADDAQALHALGQWLAVLSATADTGVGEPTGQLSVQAEMVELFAADLGANGRAAAVLGRYDAVVVGVVTTTAGVSELAVTAYDAFGGVALAPTPLHSTEAAIADVRLVGDDFAHCAVVLEQGAERSLLAAEVASLEEVAAEPLQLARTVLGRQLLTTGAVVTGSVQATWLGNGCHVAWLEQPSAAGELVLREAVLDAQGGLLRRQDLGTQALGGVVNARLETAFALGQTQLITSSARTPTSLQLSSACSL